MKQINNRNRFFYFNVLAYKLKLLAIIRTLLIND